MSLPSLLSTDKALIGNDAGWHLAFFQETDLDNSVREFGSEDYYADIRATLPGDLSGGSYLFTIEGMTNEHYEKISQTTGNGPTVVKLYLYWRDTNSNAANYLKNLAGLTDTLGKLKSTDLKDNLVAVLRVLSVTRKAGNRRYEVTIKASERIFEALSEVHICTPVLGKDTEAAVKELLERQVLSLKKGTNYSYYAPKQASLAPQVSSPDEKSAPVKEQRDLGGGRTPLELLRNIGSSLEQTTNYYGRGMLLLRNGQVHIGPRPIPLEGKPKELRLSNGLIETEAGDSYATDKNFNSCSSTEADVSLARGSSAQKPPTRNQFKLTLKGRPDIKPGDVVIIDVPDEDAPQKPTGLLGTITGITSSLPLVPSLGGDAFKNPASLYVSSVEHVLGRTSGFVTTVYGVQIPDQEQDPKAEQAWDHFSPLGQKKPKSDPPHANAETQAAHAVRNLAQDIADKRSFPEVGEVRAMTPKSQSNGNDLSQTLKVGIGLVEGKGKLNEASRLVIQHPSMTSSTDVPYLTPFAWGKCGLVLPRYPGMRVLVNYHNGNPDDPIEVGSFWEAERGPDSEQGDWWLILPVGASTDEPAADKAPDEHNGPVIHDLTDAQGNRVIEVGELTIRIDDPQSISNQPRPKRGKDQQAITLEHKKAGSKIVMDKDGNITITAAKDITLDASNGTISMTAKDVKVKVDNAMDVS